MTFIFPCETWQVLQVFLMGKSANHWLHKHMLHLFFKKPFFELQGTKAEGQMRTQAHPRVMSVTHSQFKTNLVEQSGSRTHTNTHSHIRQMSAHASPINQLWITAMNKMNGAWSCWLLRRTHLIKLLLQNLCTNVLFTFKIFKLFTHFFNTLFCVKFLFYYISRMTMCYCNAQ